jgi:hypothetical protein
MPVILQVRNRQLPTLHSQNHHTLELQDNMSDPYQWRESVLSTRSLSYASILDASDTMLLRSSTLRKNTLTSTNSSSSHADDPAFHHALAQVPPTADSLPPSVSSSPLFRLPRDLRLQVYTHLLTSQYSILWPATESESQSQSQPHALTPQLLRTCRPVYEEAAYILYTTNTPTFAHPSDANMFAHALTNRSFACLIPHITLRVRSTDTRLWTGWFNTTAAERSLVRDLPGLRQLTIRYRGPRWQASLNERANADLWLKDPRLQEVILSVRKCVAEVRLLLCVRLPDQVEAAIASRMAEAVAVSDADIIAAAAAAAAATDERLPHAMFRRWVWLNGCHIRVEPLGRDEDV